MTPPPVAAPVVRPRVTRPPLPPAGPAMPPVADPFSERLPGPPPRTAVDPGIPEDMSPFDEPVDHLSPMTASGIGFPPAAVPLAAVPLAAAGLAAAGMAGASSSTSPMASAPMATPLTAPPMATTGAPPSPATSTSVPIPLARTSRGGEEMLEAFFAGAGLTGAQPADPAAMMKGLGQAFRAVISGLRSVLIARATIKREFRIEQTMMSARANPLKFSANDDDALIALLGVGRRTDMSPAAAITDSLHDIQMHEIAVTKAMQVAVRAMMEELSPDKIRATTEQGGMALLAAQRKARAWDTFETRHAATVQALTDNFDSVFGKAFALAYERALDELSTRDKR